MNRYEITVKQLVTDNELDHEDKHDNPTGQYDYWAESEDKAIDHFHETVPISCLEDFEIEIKLKKEDEILYRSLK